jgi:asparagine synthase (glutamine-hydrolysing)
MTGIAGLICTSTTCSAEVHRFHETDLSIPALHGRPNPRHVLAVVPDSRGQKPLCPPQLPDVAHQPLWDDESRCALVYDGTLYNPADLRTELLGRARRVRSTSDAELVLQAFTAWGEASFRRLRGLFAIALYDRQHQTLYLIRDPFGQKSLYYLVSNGHLFFASELDSLIRLQPSARLNTQGLLEWSLYRHLASEATFIEGICVVRPGHCVTFVKGRIEDTVYADLADYISPDTYKRFDAASEAVVIREVEEALVGSVRQCLVGVGAMGTCCSGGVDSSLVTALASRSVDDVTAFHASAGDHEAFDERRYAEEVASTLGIPLVCCPVDRTIFQQALVQVIASNGMPLAHIHLVAFDVMVQQAHARGIRVLLTGDAADGQFGGLWYRHRRQRQLLRVKSLFSRLPRRLRNALALAASLHGGMPFTTVGLEQLLPNAMHLLDGYTRSAARLRLEQAYAFVPDAEDRAILVTMIEDFMDNWDLERADRLGAASRIECRTPFAHPDLVRLAFNLPLRYRFRGLTDKWLLKHIAANYLPRQLVYSRKRPWDFPWRAYLAPFARVAAFRDGFCAEALHVSPVALEALVSAWESNVQVFWNLLNLEIWGRLFLRHESADRVTDWFLGSKKGA